MELYPVSRGHNKWVSANQQQKENEQKIVAESASPLPSAVDAKYEVLGRLGEGGMATVYKARHRLTGHIVAIKVLIDQDLTSLKRFRQEASLTMQLRQENVVAVQDFDIVDDVAFIVMEFVEGTSLADELKKNKTIAHDRFERIVKDVCAGLQFAHDNGIVHRDIKPHNILLTEKNGQEVAKLADFGIARTAGDTNQSLTTTGEVLGTPYYLSPEQCTGQPATKQSDLYALGCVMYEMLAGKPPLIGANVLETAHLRASEKPDMAPLKKVSASTQECIEKCLQRKPENRFKNASEVVASFSAGSKRNSQKLTIAAALLAIASAAALSFYIAHQTALPDDKESLQKLAAEAMMQKNYALGDRAFQKLLTITKDPGWQAGAKEWLARSQLEQHNPGRAYAYAEEAAGLWNKFGRGNVYSAAGQLTAAEFYLRAHDPQRAADHCNNAAELLVKIPITEDSRIRIMELQQVYDALIKAGVVTTDDASAKLKAIEDAHRHAE